MQDRRTLGIAGQLYEALGSISANLAEGYSRGTSKDRARFYEYALGSARESRDWYFKSRHILGETVTEHCLSLLAEIIRLLLTMIPQQRQRTLREENISYSTDENHQLILSPFDAQKLENLLHAVPFNNS
jgi:four helix bundle protein